MKRVRRKNAKPADPNCKLCKGSGRIETLFKRTLIGGEETDEELTYTTECICKDVYDDVH